MADPYMGFNIGSTKSRVAWTGDVKRFYFESPLVRLMSDHKYEDVFVDGDDLVAAERADQPVPYRCIVIYRYYDEASQDFGNGKDAAHRAFCAGAGQADPAAARQGLRQPGQPDDAPGFSRASGGPLDGRPGLPGLPAKHEARFCGARGAVDKLFTYATPHNGIDMRIVRNMPGWLSFGDVNNFNREKMAEYLDLPKGDDVSLVKNFPPERIFNLDRHQPARLHRGGRHLGLGGGRRE